MSQIRVNDIRNSGGSWSSTPEQIFEGRAKAWVNFNGQGTVGIRDDYNVNTVSDNATGKYDINFSSAMSNSNYVATGTPGDTTAYTASVCGMDFNAPTTSKVSVSVEDLDGGATDRPYVRCVIFN